MTRALPAAWRAAAAGEAPPFALAFTLIRRDGLTLGFCDHATPLVLDGVAHKPAPIALSDGAVTFGLDDDPPQVTGILDDDGLSAADLDAGLWDDARVIVRRVDPRTPDIAVIVNVGRFGAIRSANGVYEATVLGPKAALARPIGRVFARSCDAALGDARCGVALDDPRFQGRGVVVEVVSARTVRIAGVAAYANGWFDGGVLAWGVRRVLVLAHRAEGARAAFDVEAAPPLGATVTATAGCDKRFATCREKFANAVNFRGFPHMIGPDAVIRSAESDGPATGGSRQ